MKRFFTRTLCVILAVISLMTSTVPAYATTSGTKMSGGVDYSGQGTVINGTIASGNVATVSGNYVNIPVYKGKYEAGSFNYWWTKSWSEWSTKNNKKNPDFTKYNGTNTATEYNVESRKEYKYERIETQDVYSKKYYTVYAGAHWYNCLRTFTKSQWGGYCGAMSGYKIVEKYTRYEKSGTKEVTVRDSTWRTNAPFSWPWENKWEVCNTRTTYRYRSRTLKWNPESSITTEKVPLNYSLYTQNGQPIKAGIKWEYGASERKYTKQKDRTFLETMVDNGMPNEQNLNVCMYYIRPIYQENH